MQIDVEIDGAGDVPDEEQDAVRVSRAFERAYPQAYLRFHRRDGKHSELSAASRAVLTHLAHTGPLTVGEMAQHLDRAQSVVSDIVTQLAAKGLLARERDPANGRRTLVWLTDDGLAFLDRDREVLSVDLLARAVARMSPQDRVALVRGVRALVAADDEDRRTTGENPTSPTRRTPT
ncbi:MAG: winged helix-turn-helix transcriptional regulator [Actinobacteria bacterium]|nr:winged helix-turn-helix transcriptional regulator [Actinomycetota bacterium]